MSSNAEQPQSTLSDGSGLPLLRHKIYLIPSFAARESHFCTSSSGDPPSQGRHSICASSPLPPAVLSQRFRLGDAGPALFYPTSWVPLRTTQAADTKGYDPV